MHFKISLSLYFITLLSFCHMPAVKPDLTAANPKPKRMIEAVKEIKKLEKGAARLERHISDLGSSTCVANCACTTCLASGCAAAGCAAGESCDTDLAMGVAGMIFGTAAGFIYDIYYSTPKTLRIVAIYRDDINQRNKEIEHLENKLKPE